MSNFVKNCRNCGKECNAFESYKCPNCGTELNGFDEGSVKNYNCLMMSGYKKFCEERKG